MFTAHIGRRVLALYNTRQGTDHTLRSFFDGEFHRLFYDEDRYLMKAGNSKFGQLVNNRKSLAKAAKVDGQLLADLMPGHRRDALAAFHADAETLEEAHGHLVQGGFARDVDASTSGQVTDLARTIDADEVYASWIGAAAGVGVAGGLNLLVDDDTVLEGILDGWQVYRQYLRDTEGMPGNQIETWNGQWLRHRFSQHYDARRPLRDWKPDVKPGPRLNTADWVRVVFALARALDGAERPALAYVYSFGQTNKTIGFVQLDLPSVSNLYDLYVRLFGMPTAMDGLDPRAVFEQFYATEFSVYRACQEGTIGVRALEPKALRQYMPGGDTRLPKPPTSDAAEKVVPYRIYQTWIVAMLHSNEKLLDLAQRTADALVAYTHSDDRAKATGQRTVENEVLKASRLRDFVDKLTKVVDGSSAEDAALFDGLVQEMMRMSGSDVPLLLTLIRFKYAVARA